MALSNGGVGDSPNDNSATNTSHKVITNANNATNGHSVVTSGSRNEPKPDDYLVLDCLPAGDALNRWSHTLTKDHDFPGAQVR
jgi:dihydroxy-acid dehydratase